MIGGDYVVIEPQTSGDPLVSDRYVPWTGYPYSYSDLKPQDDFTNDWVLDYYNVVGGVTFVEVTRKLDTGDR